MIQLTAGDTGRFTLVFSNEADDLQETRLYN
jgi:hypothetical protein